jgi:Cu/Ag efflux pump CusA
VVRTGILEVGGSLGVAAVVAVASVVPIFILDGVDGALLTPLAQSFLVATAVSLLAGLTLAPVLATLLLSERSVGRADSPLARLLSAGHGRALAGILRRPIWSRSLAGVLVLVAAGALALFGSYPLSPTFKERDLLIAWETAPGASRLEMNRITGNLTAELRALPGVRNVGAHTGRALAADQIVNINSGEVWLSIDAAADYGATVGAVRDVVAGYPGIRTEVMTYSDKRVREVVSRGVADDLIVRIYGQDYAVLNAKAQEVLGIVSGVDGVADPRVRTHEVVPTVEIEVFVDKAAKVGLKPGDIRRQAATLVSATVAGNLFDEQKVFEVVVWGVPEVRQNVHAIRAIRIDAPTGGPGGRPTQVALGDVADVRVVPKPAMITHDQVSRSIDVVANVRGRGLGAVTADVRDRLRGVTFPREHHLEVLGEGEAQAGAEFRLWAYAIGAAILIFFLLQAALGSWRIAAMYFLLLPAALSGGVLVAALNESAGSVPALLGLVTVLVMAVRGAILQIRQYEQLRDSGHDHGPELVALGTRQRFAPTVTSLLATAAALLPMLVIGAAAGLEVLSPLALIILAGLASTALLNLLVLPGLYLTFAPRGATAGTANSGHGVTETA